MAALHSPDTTTGQRSARRSMVPAAPKLRDSCHACATSKVRCNKQKPTCARCAKRGVACEYFVAQRAGRKTETRALRGSSCSASPGMASLTSPGLIQLSPSQHTLGYADFWANLLSPTAAAPPSMLTPLTSDFDDFLASTISFPPQEMSDPETLAQSNSYFGGINNGLLNSSGATALLFPEDALLNIDEGVSEVPLPSNPRTPPNSRASINGDVHGYQSLPSELPLCCLTRALSLLKQLSPNSSAACTRSRRQGDEHVTIESPSIQSIIVENEQTIEAITDMLQCPCSQDSYMLHIMSLIVFRVLGWYAAVASETPVADASQFPGKSDFPDHQQHSLRHSEHVTNVPTVVGKYCIDGEDQDRMVAQLVLSELHRVQRLVNLLSQRLKEHKIRNDGVNTPNSAADGQIPLTYTENMSPFSAAILDQLELDLRKRLRTLSLEIIDMLRRL